MNNSNVISIQNSVRDAIQILDAEEQKFVCIVDGDNILKGIFTQGDMRRYLLNNGDISASILYAMNTHPIVFYSRDEAIHVSQKRYLVVYPIVDKTNHLMDYYVTGEPVYRMLENKPLKNTPLVMMAGGKGTRLYPYTKILPKALIPIGDLTISERIINQFTNWGCNEIYLILNHKSGMIKAYYEELDKAYKIHYIEEKRFMGTGGGLSLLKGMINTTFILSNCDILVDADYDCILKTHLEQKNLITFVAAMKNIVIPYGVITTLSNGQILNMHEKPEMSFLTNTGMYIIEPRIIDDLSSNEFIHITDIAQHYLDKHEKIGAFPVSEKAWLDMGQFSEMDTMLKNLGINT